ncbi:DUF1353 domain-containing protein [bacterium]|nr:DUF1353 domain-containing protein [bacterium]
MTRKIEVNFSRLPIVKIRVIDKDDPDFVIKSKKKYPFILSNSVKVAITEKKNRLDFEFEIPKGYIWNGADIPKSLFVFGQSKDNNYLLASMVHDFMLEHKLYIYKYILEKSITPSEYRKLTSLIFREILKDEKTNVLKANFMSFAVDFYQTFFNSKQWKTLGGD